MYTDEEINEEIRKNGNTNLITHSNLPSKSEIYALGDSHSIFFYISLKIHEHWLRGQIFTIYKFIESDLDLYNIGNFIKFGHDAYNIKENDYVIFYFGYNDVQKQIHTHASTRWREEISELCRKYLNKIIDLKYKFKIKPILSCIYPNPLPNSGNESSGTDKERRLYTLYMNEVLSILCSIYNIPFLDVYDIITDESGNIKSEYTTDLIHLDYKNKELREIIENKVYELCN
jgi:hypothetical protein